jgi:hypothetical protein
LILIRNQSTYIEKGKPKNNSKIRQHEKTNPSLNSPSPFPLSNPFFLIKQLPVQLSTPSNPAISSDACGLPSLPHPTQPAVKAAAAVIVHDLPKI